MQGPNYDVCFKKGKDNVLADYLSRVSLDNVEQENFEVGAVEVLKELRGVSEKELVQELKSDSVMQRVFKYLQKGWSNENEIPIELGFIK